jgi:aspartate 1-decarboxylase
VQVLDLNNGARFTTYAIEGKEGGGDICLNGASARLASKGDIIIILTYCQVEDSEAENYMSKLVYVDVKNNIIETRRAIETLPF